MGEFKTRKDVTVAAKAELLADWFLVVRFTDGTWDYAQPGRFITLQNRAEQIMYQRSRSSGNWYIKRD